MDDDDEVIDLTAGGSCAWKVSEPERKQPKGLHFITSMSFLHPFSVK